VECVIMKQCHNNLLNILNKGADQQHNVLHSGRFSNMALILKPLKLCCCSQLSLLCSTE
jgi:hypothetical protein